MKRNGVLASPAPRRIMVRNMKTNMNGDAAKITGRYASASACACGGVSTARRISGVHAKRTPATINERIGEEGGARVDQPLSPRDVAAADRLGDKDVRPHAAPAEHLEKVQMALVVAARAVAPSDRLTQNAFTEALSDCRMLVVSKDNADSSRVRPTGPVVRLGAPGSLSAPGVSDASSPRTPRPGRLPTAPHRLVMAAACQR